MQQPADVVIFVKPLTGSSASIGVAYNRLLSQEIVKDDLRQLLSGTGWKYGGDLVINDASLHPERPKLFPPTTAAMLTVLDAPQVRDSAPVLLAYLKAFQRYTHVEVNFVLPDLNPYNGVDNFTDKALIVELYKDQGVYRYETEIRDHNNPLPDLFPVVARPPVGVAVGPVTESISHGTPSRSNLLGGILLFGGIALLAAGYGTYLIAMRRTGKNLAQTTQRR
jgi:hypothetical protein